MKVLTEAGADVNNKNTRGGETVLHWASWDVNCLKILLQSGVKVNRQDENSMNALQRYIHCPHDVIKENAMYLCAAGETTDGSTLKTGDCRKQYMGGNGVILKGRRNKPVKIPDYLLNTNLEPCLQSLCREAIRKHLMTIDLHGNLFSRVPRLGLPSTLCKYLLYYMSREDEEQQGREEADPEIL